MRCNIKRALGKKIDLNGSSIFDLTTKEFYSEIVKNLFVHGVVCVTKQNKINPVEYLECAGRLGRNVRLPPQLAFSNTLENYPEIACVGNINNTGDVMKNY